MNGIRYLLNIVVAIVLVALCPSARAGEPGRLVVLTESSYWRYYIVWKTELVQRKDGLEAIPDLSGKKPPVVVSQLPPANWAAPDFDDSTWSRLRGPVTASSSEMAVFYLRGKFEVKDPAKGGELELSAAVTGGAVVHLNGLEVARIGLPGGDIAPDAAADPLPDEAFVDPDGNLYRNGWGDPEKFKVRLDARVRRASDVKIPPSRLRKGVNVLAIQVHRAPASELLLTAKPLRWKEEAWRGRGYYWWNRLAFSGLMLTAPPGTEAVVPNVARPSGVHIWNQPIPERPLAGDYGDPNEPLRPVRMVGVRNAVVSGEVVVGSDRAMGAIKAVPCELKQKGGPGNIPAAAMEIRYLRPDGPLAGMFDSLAESPPDKMSQVQPVWIRIRIPRDTAPGDYAGTVALVVDGGQNFRVPVEVKVFGWTMPGPRDFTAHVGLVQSPETLALYYKVDMWSEEHWKLIERTFELLGEVGNKVVFLPLLRRTHFGNEHTMVRWVRKEGGGYAHDFSIAEKYLDIALKHMGKPQVVCLYCWEPYTGYKYLDHAAKGGGKGMLFTILDPKTGALEEAEGPHWGEPAVRDFWRPVFDGMCEILRKRGLEKSMMVGVAGDSRPTKEAVDDLKAVAPQARWVVHSHATADNLWGVPVGYLSDVWAAPVAPDPAVERRYGWKSAFLRTTFPRAGSNTVGPMGTTSPLAQYMVSLEGMQAAGIHGFGRMGADFWFVLPGREGRNRNLLGRFPESSWAQLNMENSAPYILMPAKGGAVPTLRFEMLRASQQTTEARIFIEKALTDTAMKARLGDELAARSQRLLDDRTRAILYARAGGWSWFLSSGWQARDEALYSTASEVAGRLAAP